VPIARATLRNGGSRLKAELPAPLEAEQAEDVERSGAVSTFDEEPATE
jgi:hypothetical protein